MAHRLRIRGQTVKFTDERAHVLMEVLGKYAIIIFQSKVSNIFSSRRHEDCQILLL